MKRLPDRYYDLILERDQLLEESEYILNQTPVDALRFIALTTQIVSLEEDIKEIEKEMDAVRITHIISKEIYVQENDDFYSFVNEYNTFEEAEREFKIQKEELKKEFTDYKELYESEDRLYIRDDVEVLELCLYEAFID